MCQRCDSARARACEGFKAVLAREPTEAEAAMGEIQICLAIVRERLGALEILFPGGARTIPDAVWEEIESHLLAGAGAASNLRRLGTPAAPPG